MLVFQPGEFVGLVPMIEQFLQSVDDCDVDTHCTITQYLHLIQKRASGKHMGVRGGGSVIGSLCGDREICSRKNGIRLSVSTGLKLKAHHI